MKPHLFAVLLSSSLAVAQPAAPKPLPAPPDAQPKQSAFLGVGTIAVPAEVANHLDLKPGTGLMVDSLQVDGPAANAGIARHDIITRIAGKPIASTLELGAAVRSHQPGEALHIDLIHQGNPVALDVKLGGRPIALADTAELRALEEIPADQLTKDMQQRLEVLKKQVGDIKLQLDANAANLANPAAGMGRIEIHQGGTLQMRDEQGSVEWKSHQNGKEVIVRDLTGKAIWSGPWDSEQDQEAAPAEIRSRVKRFNINGLGNGGFQLRIGGAIEQPPPADDGK